MTDAQHVSDDLKSLITTVSLSYTVPPHRYQTSRKFYNCARTLQQPRMRIGGGTADVENRCFEDRLGARLSRNQNRAPILRISLLVA